MQQFTSIPFKSEADSGFSSVNGVAKFSSAGIVLEFESKVLGLISKGVKEERLPMSELLDVKFKKGVLRRGAKIEIRLNSFTRLTQLPSQEGKITLKIGAEDWERARDAVAQLHKDREEKAASLPPTHTPVSLLFDPSENETEELTGQNRGR
jgi:hypothetical protein